MRSVGDCATARIPVFQSSNHNRAFISSLLSPHSSLYRLSHFSSISLAGSDTAMATAAL